MPGVSVVVPVYKVEKYIHRCMNSILAQTFTDYEVILVDDGSPDNCGAICDEYAAKDSRIRVIHQENQSLSIARNVGVDAAESDLIMFVDSDDALHPRILELLYGALQSTGAVMAAAEAFESEDIGDFMTQPRGAESVKVYDIDDKNLADVLKRGYIGWSSWAKLIPKRILQKYRFEKGRSNQDTAVASMWLYEAGKLAVVPEQLYFYWINPAGISKRPSNKTKYFFDALWAREQIAEFFEEKDMNTVLQLILRRYFMIFSSGYHEIKKTDPNLARKIRKKGCKSWHRWGKKTVLPLNEREYVMDMIYPIWEKAYEYIMCRLVAIKPQKSVITQIAEKSEEKKSA